MAASRRRWSGRRSHKGYAYSSRLQIQKQKSIKQRTLLFAFACLAAADLTIAADQVTLKNGDRLTGAVVKKDATNLVFKSDHVGLVTIPWDQVSALKTDTPVTIALTGGESVLGTVAVAPEQNVEIQSGGQSRSVEPAQVEALRNADEQHIYERMLKPHLTDLWVIGGNIGIAGTKGNAATVAGATAQTAQAVRGGWAYNRNIRPRLFWNLFNDYEYDRFQNLDLRMVLGTGLGYSVWKSERGQLDLVGGMAWNREKFDPAPKDPFTTNKANAYWGDDFTCAPTAASAFSRAIGCSILSTRPPTTGPL